MTSETDPLGNTKYFTYDKNSRIVGVKDRNGNQTKYILDGNGNIVETVDAYGNSSYFAYDPMNRLSKVTLNRVDSLHSVNEKQETLYYYDKRGLVKQEVNALGDGKFSVYDGNGNLVQVTDEDGNITEYGYSPVNLATSASYTGGKQASFLYNGTGELVSFKDWNGDTSIARDLLNRIVSVNDHNGKQTQYGYDPVGNVTAIGYPDGGQVDYYYDRENRITRLVDVVDGVYDFTYDPNGNLKSKEYPNFELSKYYYDANNQPIEMDEFGLAGGKVLATLYAWDPNGNLLSEKSYTHGLSQQIVANTGQGSGTGSGNTHRGEFKVPPPMTVTADGTVLNPAGNAPPGLQRGADPGKASNPNKPAGGALGANNNGGLQEIRVFTYDKLDRMATGNLDGTKTTYTYDTVGNLIQEQTGPGNTSIDYRYNVMNQLVRKQTNSDTSTYAYDKRGNRIGETTKNKTQSYVYDGTNHLTRGVNGFGDASEYTYNALFMRVNNTQIAHSGNTYSRDYVIDYTSGVENNDLVVYAKGEYYQQQVYLKTSLFGEQHGERLMQLTDTSTANSGIAAQERKLYIHEDPLGTTKKFTKGDGTEFSALKYDAWGLPAQPNKLTNNDHGNFIAANFTGHTYDTVLGFYFAEVRHYDPLGRTWAERDPAKDGLNWYRYCGNNPGTYRDASGKFIQIAIGAAVGAVIGGVASGIKLASEGKSASEIFTSGEFWASVGVGAAGGALVGTGVGAVAGASMIGGLTTTTVVASGVAAGVGTGITVRGAYEALSPNATAGSIIRQGLNGKDVLIDAALSLGTIGVGAALKAVASKFIVPGCKNAFSSLGRLMGGTGNALDDGLGTYAKQGGHHPMAKTAFEGIPGYDPNSSLTISPAKLSEFKVRHATITGQQNALYTEYAKTGQPLTMDAMKQIEIKAMTNSGVPVDYATNAVEKAIEDLLKSGVTKPIKIPWN